MIHWDWVWTIEVILAFSFLSSFIMECLEALFDSIKKEKLLAEAEAERAKRERILAERSTRVSAAP